MFDININNGEQRLIELWGNCYTAFNTIKFESGKWTVTGGDYSADEEFYNWHDLIDFIREEVTSAIMEWVEEGDINTLTEVCKIEE